jgi:DNA-binding response OmpR family regulator
MQALMASKALPLSPRDLIRLVWGYEHEDEASASELVRSHIRNLRTRLAEIGLADIVRSRRGGYWLELPS